MAEQTYHPPVPAPGAYQPYPPTPPHGYRRSVRSHLRHPLENLCLVLVILGSFLVWAVCGYEVASAFVERRQPDPYAVILLAAPVLIYFLRGQLYAQQRLNGV